MAFFNADDRAAVLNGGSYTGISRQIRQRVNREYADFVIDCVNRHESFAIETTLRSQVTIEQARLAKSAGFRIELRYLALEGFAMHLERVKARTDAGGHSASESVLRRIHDANCGSMTTANSVDRLSLLWKPKLAQSCFCKIPPAWLSQSLGTPYATKFKGTET